MAKAGNTAIHAFGIGSNVSDNLLLQLARRTHGGVELIHPGERIEDKVVTALARAIAPRVRDLRLEWIDVELQDFAPAVPPALIDGEPFLVAARYRRAGRGALELRGKLNGADWYLRLPVTLPERASLPAVQRLWAAERVRDLEAYELEHPEQGTQARIVALATEHDIASRYTSFVVRETRSPDRRADSAAKTQVVPVHAPSGWAMYELVGSVPPAMSPASSLPPRQSPLRTRAPKMASAVQTSFAPRDAASAPPPSYRFAANGGHDLVRPDPAFALLAAQLASGLWDEPQQAGDAQLRQLRASTEKLLELLRAGIDAAHPQHGPLIRKALGPLAQLAAANANRAPELAERALAVAWLCASGPRSKRSLRATIAAAGLSALATRLEDHAALRTWLLGG